MGLHLYRSNRLETLASALAGVTGLPLHSPFEDEVIVVQSLGMRRWLSLQLASRHGITMNATFAFPAAFMQRIFVCALGKKDHDRAFDREVLPWRILALLPSLLDRPAFAELTEYLRGDIRPVKEFQLVQRIAAVIDRYLAYRPEMLLKWAKGAEPGWQAELWRALIEGHETTHAPALALRLHDALERTSGHVSKLPERVSIFGLSSLPPFYVQLIGQIASRIDVHFFLLEPTALYWGEIRSLQEQKRILRRQKKSASAAPGMHFEVGHSLLASMGRVGREFSNLLLDLDPIADCDLFEAPARKTLLSRVQADIFRLSETVPSNDRLMEEEDRSIQVHCCHSPGRELEVLHDQLLAMLERDPSLTPKDVLVAMPDVESYAPFIEAVFGTPEDPTRAIPFTIADRGMRAQSCVADVFLGILDLRHSRFGAAAVLALLEARPVQRRFELAGTDLDIIRRWIDRSGIRWGIDSAHRALLGLPAFEDNTWRAGLRRLLLGYAFPGDGETLFDGLLPVREVEGALSLILGRFVEFAESLFSIVAEFRESRTLRDWEFLLRRVVHTFFNEDDESAEGIRRLRAVLDSLGRAQRDAGLDTLLEFDVIRAYISQALDDSDGGLGFLAGRVTFCALKPMRSIPFKVICLLGMNDTAFPRQETAPTFDLVAQQPRPGDRSLRDDDRQLFLETLLSARDVLYISYCGRSAKDNTESPPSVLVNELLDYLEEHFARRAGDLRKDSLVTEHRLQAFDRDYFQESSSLFSYSEENFHASQRAAKPRHPSPPFFTSPISVPESGWQDVALDDLTEFFCHPAKFFLRRRLQLRLPDEVTVLDEREPVSLEGLDRYAVERDLVRRRLAGLDAAAILALARAGGKLPPGLVGDAHFRATIDRVELLLERLREPLATAPLASLPVAIELDGWRLSGTLEQIRPAALIRFRPANLKARDLIRAWLAHLALNAAARPNDPHETLLEGLDVEHRFLPVKDSLAELRNLLGHYVTGLREPLRFFPATSWTFAIRAFGRKKLSGDPLEKARREWEGDEFSAGERADPYMAVCFRHVAEPLDAQWRELTASIYKPLLEHLA